MNKILIVATLFFGIAALAFNIFPTKAAADAPPAPKLPNTPELPRKFGYKTAWLAIKTNDPQQVLAKLPTQSITPTGWQTGIVEAEKYHSNTLFVTPPINGWVLVTGGHLLGIDPLQPDFAKLTQPLLDTFGSVQYFGNYRVIGYIAWCKAENGKWQRQFTLADGNIFLNEGAYTEAERAAGIPDFSIPTDDDEAYYANEDYPPQLAEQWSVNPQLLEDLNLPAGTGWLIQLKPD